MATETAADLRQSVSLWLTFPQNCATLLIKGWNKCSIFFISPAGFCLPYIAERVKVWFVVI